ncbi:MAG: hypothetical protein HY302_06740 [Opitutae bacterium]|nr:hypothetical protein [Opitutae bacterium]
MWNCRLRRMGCSKVCFSPQQAQSHF